MYILLSTTYFILCQTYEISINYLMKKLIEKWKKLVNFLQWTNMIPWKETTLPFCRSISQKNERDSDVNCSLQVISPNRNNVNNYFLWNNAANSGVPACLNGHERVKQFFILTCVICIWIVLVSTWHLTDVCKFIPEGLSLSFQIIFKWYIHTKHNKSIVCVCVCVCVYTPSQIVYRSTCATSNRYQDGNQTKIRNMRTSFSHALQSTHCFYRNSMP
jgi:hypothetical protein